MWRARAEAADAALMGHIDMIAELQAAYRHLEAAEAERDHLQELFDRLAGVGDEMAAMREQAVAERDRAQLNLRRMALLAEAFIYEPRRITEGGLVAQIHNALTDQDVEYNDDRAAPTEGTE